MAIACRDGVVAVLEADHAARARLLEMAQQAGLRALGFSQVPDLLEALHAGWLSLVLVVSDSDGHTQHELHAQLQPYLREGVAMVHVIAPDQLAGMLPGLQHRDCDFVVSPYTAAELWARVTRLLSADLRQADPMPSRGGSAMVLQKGLYVVDPVQRSVSFCGTPLALSQREFDLAYCLFQQPGRMWGRDALCRAAWGQDLSQGSRNLDTYMSRLRNRLQLYPANGWRLTAIYGRGYRLDAMPAPGQAVGAANADSMSPASLAGVS